MLSDKARDCNFRGLLNKLTKYVFSTESLLYTFALETLERLNRMHAWVNCDWKRARLWPFQSQKEIEVIE